MLKVVVESAKGIPKKTLGLPDPIATILFKGKSSRFPPLLKRCILFYFKEAYLLNTIFKMLP